MKIKKCLFLSSALAVGLLTGSCSSEEAVPTDQITGGNTLTFSLSLPAGEKVGYTRADEIHTEDEFRINTLSIYEYKVADGKETLTRVLKSDAAGLNGFELDKGSSNNHTITIIVPSENIGSDFTYRFVANDAVESPAIGSLFSSFQQTPASLVLNEGNSADALSNYGIAMTGVAKCDEKEVFTMAENLTCKVELTRIVSRIDISYETPNLKVTSVRLLNAPVSGPLFPQALCQSVDDADCIVLGRNAHTDLPTDFLRNEGKDKEEIKKAFYLYERQNSAESSAIVRIEYEVSHGENGDKIYHGTVDVDFAKANGEYVAAERNHLYNIILGNGKEPVAGEVKATLNVMDWIGVDIEDYLTPNDKEINNQAE